MLALSLSFASGAMLYVVFGELLPEAILTTVVAIVLYKMLPKLFAPQA